MAQRATRATTKKTDISEAGTVNTYFQFASQIKCMKKQITSIAFVHDTAIMNTQPTAGVSLKGHSEEYVKNDMVVSTQSATNTMRYLPVPPCE